MSVSRNGMLASRDVAEQATMGRRGEDNAV